MLLASPQHLSAHDVVLASTDRAVDKLRQPAAAPSTVRLVPMAAPQAKPRSPGPAVNVQQATSAAAALLLLRATPVNIVQWVRHHRLCALLVATALTRARYRSAHRAVGAPATH